MACSLVNYLEKGQGVKITELVLDFVVDQNKKPWLLELRVIRSRNLSKLWDICSSEEIELLTEKNNNSQNCHLCNMNFSKQQLKKLITNKLIWELIAHLQSRKINIEHVPYLRKEGMSYVCEVCYQVIVAEHRLIDV